MMPSPASFPFVRALQQRGARVYAVGGTVRDELLGYPRKDLDQHVLRQVSMQAFPEDPLRMLRGIQLAARFELQIEPGTRDAMRTHAATIRTIAPERIAEELRKLLQARAPSQGFVAMHEVG